MATTTTNYSLPVFSSTDSVDLIGVYNAAMQIIDTKLKSIESQMGTHLLAMTQAQYDAAVIDANTIYLVG